MSTIFHRPEMASDLVRKLLRPSVLDEALRSGLFLSGMRRVGKTTFLRNDLIPALETAGALVIYVDLWTDTTANPALLTHAAIRAALDELQTPKSAVLRRLKRVNGLSLGAAGFKFGFTLESVGAVAGTTLAQALTSVVDQAKTDLVFIIDEVQQAISSDDGNAMLMAMKAARDAINQRPDTPGYFLFVGTGSHRALVSELTARRNQAFAGATSRLYPVLDREYVTYLLDRMAQDNLGPLPSQVAAVQAFSVLGHRPEELKKAIDGLVQAFPSEGEVTQIFVDQMFNVAVGTVRASLADADLRVLESIGVLAEAVFDRIAGPLGEKGVFSASAAAEYSKIVGRAVHVEEIQPVVNALLAANLIMRKGHGSYVITDPFVRTAWLERAQIEARGVSNVTAGDSSRKKPADLPTPRRKKRRQN